jgi:hypothetical protein
VPMPVNLKLSSTFLYRKGHDSRPSAGLQPDAAATCLYWEKWQASFWPKPSTNSADKMQNISVVIPVAIHRLPPRVTASLSGGPSRSLASAWAYVVSR